jgi:fumarate hydratase, class II
MPKKLYGPSTEKAIKNFPVSTWTMPEDFLQALAVVKMYAAEVNGSLRQIPKGHAIKIARAAKQIASGKHMDQFPLDVFQTGSGTSTNMNMNEVIAAISSKGVKRGKGNKGNRGDGVHPNDHVNCGQSSNDVIPTALNISCALKVCNELLPVLTHLEKTFQAKAKEFHGIIKTGRTHNMDAVPVRLGDEFKSYATLISQTSRRVQDAAKLLNDLPLGGTAAGTGLNAHPQFAKRVIAKIAKQTRMPFREARDHVAAQSFPIGAQALSGSLREVAVVLHKVANDIRWMGSGPVAGLNEIKLPTLQPGSSIMPGKVNPVIPESVIQVAAHVIGADVSVGVWGAQGGVFELNTCTPFIANSLLTSIGLLTNVSKIFADKCVKGIKANKKVLEGYVERNAMLVTALVPIIGYDEAAKIAKEAMRTGERIVDVAVRNTDISKKRLEKILDPRKMV